MLGGAAPMFLFHLNLPFPCFTKRPSLFSFSYLISRFLPYFSFSYLISIKGFLVTGSRIVGNSFYGEEREDMGRGFR